MRGDLVRTQVSVLRGTTEKRLAHERARRTTLGGVEEPSEAAADTQRVLRF